MAGETVLIYFEIIENIQNHPHTKIPYFSNISLKIFELVFHLIYS